MEETDEEILSRYKDGDAEAFRKLIERYTSALYNFAARMAGKRDAPDIVQEIFIKIWKNIRRFDPSKAGFKTWLFTIARNTITDFLRKKKNLLFSDMETGAEEDINSFAQNVPDEALLPVEALERLEDGATLNRILEQLPALSREILVLHYQEEMTFEEVGKILSKPSNTVKSQHRRAILELRKMINR